MWRSNIRVWSPIELDYLKAHQKDSVDQLTIALARGRSTIKKKIAEINGEILPSIRSKKRTKIGKRKDLGLFVRSGWEANICRWFKYLGYSYQYEPQVFFFNKHKKGTVSYCPDFKMIEEKGNYYWVEVKGQLTQKGKTALNRFKKYYPDEFKKVRAIPGRPGTGADKFFSKIGIPVLAYFNDLDKKYKDIILNWE